MFDVLYIVIIVAFFAVALWYARACERGIGAD